MTTPSATVLEALQGLPRGLRSAQIAELTCLREKPVRRALEWLRDQGKVSSVRDGGHCYWLLTEFAEAAAAAIAAELKERQRARWRDKQRRKTLARINRPRREWGESSNWTPPGPRIPSVWHLATAQESS